MINSTQKIFTSFFSLFVFSDIMVFSLMALIIAVAKKFVRNIVKMYGKFVVFIVILPANRWHFFHAVQC